jgi:hypothetical protein
MEGFDQLKVYIENIKEIVSEPFYDAGFRKKLRQEFEPYLNAFIDEKGGVRFKPSQLDADGLPRHWAELRAMTFPRSSQPKT